ncbi:uncharacterized protein LOC141889379 [Acropora palmata]|uniref:uncharacterized protein LOC141889379 n=1 Tax=Acropora palmata TaxID=6131 RepID=UPI003DA14139
MGSAATENPENSLSSVLASFASGHSEDDEDDNSRLTTEGSQSEEAPPQSAWGPNALVDGVLKQKATLASVGGVSASKTGKSEEVPEEGATAEIISMQTEPSRGARGETTPQQDP